MSIKESGEMYLETILILSNDLPKVRSIDIAEYRSLSKPSVCRAVAILKKDGYVITDSDGYIKLTAEGEKKAKIIYERHMLLSRLLMNLGVDEETATEDACRIEHYISEKTFDAIKKHVKEHSTKE